MKKGLSKQGRAESGADDTQPTVVVSADQGNFGTRMRTRKFRYAVLGVVLVLVVAVGVGFFIMNNDQESTGAKTPAQRYLSDQLSEPVPEADATKVSYYGGLADSYFANGDYKKALESFLKADKYLQKFDTKTREERSLNLGIAQTYAKLGNKELAKEYYEREISLLKSTGGDKYIPNIRKLEEQL